MTITNTKRQLIETILALIVIDDTDMVRRSISALNRQGILKLVIDEAKRRDLCVLRIGRYIAFFNPSRLAWLNNPQPVDI